MPGAAIRYRRKKSPIRRTDDTWPVHARDAFNLGNVLNSLRRRTRLFGQKHVRSTNLSFVKTDAANSRVAPGRVPDGVTRQLRNYFLTLCRRNPRRCSTGGNSGEQSGIIERTIEDGVVTEDVRGEGIVLRVDGTNEQRYEDSNLEYYSKVCRRSRRTLRVLNTY